MRVFCFGDSHLWSMLGRFGLGDTLIEAEKLGLQLLGWKFGSTGATAYALIEDESDTMAGPRILETLDSYPDPDKRIFLVFGEVDVTEHVGRHGLPHDESAAEVVSRYMQFCRRLLSRPDVTSLAVASVVPHSRAFVECRPGLLEVCRDWNGRLRDACAREGVAYVDWYGAVSRGLCDSEGYVPDRVLHGGASQNERHMDPNDDIQELLCRQLKSIL